MNPEFIHNNLKIFSFTLHCFADDVNEITRVTEVLLHTIQWIKSALQKGLS